MKVKKLLSLFLALVLALGVLSPAVVADAAVLDPDDYKIYHQMGVGDVVDLSTFSVDTPEAIDDYLDVLEDLGYKRIYWRGLEQAIMTEQLVVRPEAAMRALRNMQYGRSMYWEGNSFDDPSTAEIETIDTYLVQEAHKRGMEVIGQCKWADYGGFGDSSYLPFPYGMYSYHKEHPEWAPVDEWGLMTQGGAVEFSYEGAREYVVNTIMEEIEKAGYDGVLFIGYTENYDQKYEDQFGYNDPAVEEFKNRYGKTPEQDGLNYNVSLEHWRMLRGEYLTQFLREMKAALKEYSAESGNGDIVAISINSSKFRQPEIWSSYYDSMVTNNAYLDFETYAKEGIVDELHVKGNTDLAKQTKLLDDLIWLCRGTETQVVISSSVVDHTKFGMEYIWEPYLQQGVAIENFYTLADGSGPGGNFLANDHSIYKCAPDISDKIDTMSGESQLRYHVAQVANGYEQATFEELKGWILGGGVIVPRMAMSAMLKYYTNDPRTAEVLEEVIATTDQIGVRGLALRYVGVYNRTTPTMLDTILDCIDKDYAMGTFECGRMALQKMNKDALWTAFADSTSSLRTKAMILEALNGTVLNEDQIKYLHDQMVGDGEDNWKTNYLDIYSDDLDKAMEATYKNYLRWYGVSLTYHGVRGEASAMALENLLEFMASDDTGIAGQAIDTVDTGMTAGVTQFTDGWKAETLAVLKARFTALSTEVDYGDGPTYTVSDWNEWAYRLIGRSMLSLGDAGKAAMNEFYTGSDPKLALYAFKCMYLPVDEYKAIYMTYDEYKEAYSHLPRAFNSYTSVKIEQDFEDTSLFNAASTGHFGDNATTGGRWSFIGSNTKISDINTHSGNQSVLLSGNMTGNEGSAVNNTILTAGKDYCVSAWIYHEGGTFNISTAVSGTNGNKFSDPTGAEVFVRIDDDGKVWFYDYANGETAELKDTGLTVQKNKWTQITIEAMRGNDLNKATVSVRPEGGETQSSAPFSIVPHGDVMILRMTHQNDSATCVDDVLWLLPELDMDVVEEKVITLESDSVVYDGNPHGLTAVTVTDTLNVEYTYKDSQGNALTGEPVNAGIYTVTATVTDDGYDGASATATLEIRRANTVITGTATATPVQLGRPLGDSELSTDGLVVTPYGGNESLTGTYSWDNPGSYYTNTGMRTFTFTPDDPNYKPCKGSVLVNVTGDAYQGVAVLDQDFEDTDLFKTDATEAYTAGDADTVGGLWNPLYAQSAENGAAIYALDDGQAVRVVRGSANNKLVASVNNGVASDEDFTLTFRIYATGEAGENTAIELPTGTVYFMSNGYLRLGTSKTTFHQYSLETNKWSTVTVKSDRANGTFSVTVQPDGGIATTFEGATLDNAGLSSIAISATANSTCTSYIDDIRLDKMVLTRAEESTVVERDILNQNFDDTDLFKTNATEAYTAGDADTVGGLWKSLYSQSVDNGAAIYNVESIGGDGQAVRVVRGSANNKLVASVNNGVASDEDFTLTFRIYATGEAGENTAIELPTGTVYFMSNGYLRLGTSKTTFHQYSLETNKWSTVTVKSDRANGTFSVTVQPDGGIATTFEGATLDNAGLSSIAISATANSTCTSYIDDVRLTKLTVESGIPVDYLVAMNPDVSAVVGETVNVQLNVISNTKATYNTFRYELSYDADMLAYAGATTGVTVDSSTPGKLIVTGSGVDKAISDIIKISFTAKAGGTAKVILNKAYVADTEVADIEGAKAALVTVSETTVTISGYAVTLPVDFKGAEGVTDGADYTFTAKDPNYDYSFDGSTMGGASVEVLDNGDGTFTVKNVSGDLVIVGRKTAKVFTVSVVGNAKDDAVAEETATYAEAYSFTVNMSEDYTYSVHVTINGEAYTPEKNGSTYTIAGADIVGDVVITVNKTVTPSTPVIEGVENGGVYYGQLTVTVTDPDGDLAKVYLDGSVTTLQNGKLVIIPNSKLFERSVKAVDAAGNETVVEFTVYEAAVETVVTMIGEIGEVTLRDTELIEAARAAYDALTENQKAQVFNYDVLLAAEAALKALQDALPKISGNLSLNETIDINFIIPAEVDMTDAVLVVKNAATGEDVEYTILPGIGGTTVVRFSAKANHMTDEITVQVFDADGNALTQMASMSVRKYAGIRFAVAEETEKMMLIRMLDYGALAQINSGVTTDLANSIVTDELRSFANAYDWADAVQLEVPAGSGGVFKAGLALNETIDVTVYTAATNVADGDKFVVKCNGEELAADQYIVRLLDDGRYVIRYSVKSNEMSDEIYIAIVTEDGAVKAETTLGVRIYAQKFLKAVPTGNQAAMLLAMLDYGAMAQIYAGNTENLANCFITDDMRQVLIGYAWPAN